MVKPLRKKFLIDEKVIEHLADHLFSKRVIDMDLGRQIWFGNFNLKGKVNTLFDELIRGGDVQTYNLLKESLRELRQWEGLKKFHLPLKKLLKNLQKQEEKVKTYSTSTCPFGICQ